MYAEILDAGATSAIPTILNRLASHGGSILICCTLGKGRTEVIVALILSLCGVREDDNAKDCSLTEKSMKADNERLHRLLLKISAVKETPASVPAFMSAECVAPYS